MRRLFFISRLLATFLPMPLKRVIYTNFFGFKISKPAFIGFSYISSKHLEMSDGARIGHLTIFRGLKLIRMGQNSRIGNLNWFTHDSILFVPTEKFDGYGSVVLEEESAITNRHYFDVQGGFKVGRFSTIAGVRSTFLGHEINFKSCKQTANTVIIGSYSFIGSNVVVLSGSQIGDKVIVAAGSLVRGSNFRSSGIYGGVPAKLIRTCAEGNGYFSRRSGYVN